MTWVSGMSIFFSEMQGREPLAPSIKPLMWSARSQGNVKVIYTYSQMVLEKAEQRHEGYVLHIQEQKKMKELV